MDNGAQQGTTDFRMATDSMAYDRAVSYNPQDDFDLEKNDISSIADFLSKPVRVATGAYSTTDVANDVLYSSSIHALFDAQTIWKNKIQGFLNFRGTVKFRLVINPTPFHAGFLRLCYFPAANLMPSSVISHRYGLIQKSQLPGCYLNLNSNFVELSVPYVTPYTYIERDQTTFGSWGDWGQVYLDVFTPLRTTSGPSTVEWTLWMSVEDVELSGMVQPQMDSSRPSRPARGIDCEANSGKGPISKIMSSGISLANSISEIPSLAPLVKPASWVLQAARGVADAFGWSKPTKDDGPDYYSRGLHWYMANSNGNDNAAPLSLRTDNRVSLITDAAPGTQDELSIEYLSSCWSYLEQISWDTSVLAGAELEAILIQPSLLTKFDGTPPNQRVSVPACLAPSLMYNNYRGSFEIRVRIVKTGFHTGSLSFTWTPGKLANPPTFADTSYMYREIVDIQTGSELVFTLPYLIPQDFVTINESIGVFSVHVVNALKAPSTVSDTIDLVWEIRGGKDLTWVNPTNKLAFAPLVWTADPAPPLMGEVEPQGVEVTNSGAAIVKTLASSQHTQPGIHHAMIANGELQMSLLDILKAYYSINWRNTYGIGTNGGRPSALATGLIYAVESTSGGIVSPECGGDMYSLISSFYAFRRGSIRYRVCNKDNTATNTNLRAMYIDRFDMIPDPLTLYTQPSVGTTWWSKFLADEPATLVYTGSSRMAQFPQDNGGIAVQTPFYSRYRYMANDFVYQNTPLPDTTTSGLVAFADQTAIGAKLTRAVGDDFQLSFFVGVPVLRLADVSNWINPA